MVCWRSCVNAGGFANCGDVTASGSGKGIHIALEQRYLLCRYVAALRKGMRVRLKLESRFAL
jgi:hypothetical protein